MVTTDVAGPRSGNGSELDERMIPDDAFISPDDPMVYDPFREALISPDDPFEPREEDGGVVVGMDGSTRHEATGSMGLLLDLEEVTATLEAVSADLKKNGIDGLQIDPGLSAFEKNLKQHLVEYLSH